MSAALLELADRVEAASGSDRGLDEAILATTGYEGYLPTPDFTASLDAAMELVPEGWTVEATIPPAGSLAGSYVRVWKMSDGTGYIRGNTPALALCAAALRARANA